MDDDLVAALCLRGIDVRTASDHGMLGCSDVAQLRWSSGQSQGAEKMTLDCHSANSVAIGFYKNLRYQTTGLLMRKLLDAADEPGE
jgi:hypothetical protein